MDLKKFIADLAAGYRKLTGYEAGRKAEHDAGRAEGYEAGQKKKKKKKKKKKGGNDAGRAEGLRGGPEKWDTMRP